MRIVIFAINNLVNKFLCVELARRHDILAVFHPTFPPRSFRRTAGSLHNMIAQRGILAVLSHTLTRGIMAPVEGSPSRAIARVGPKFFAEYDALYEHLIAPR